MNWWSMRPGREREAAKTEAENPHPVERVFNGRRFWRRGSRRYFFRDESERHVQFLLADAGLPPAPRNLCYAYGDELTVTGRFSGRSYEAFFITSRLLSDCLQLAGRIEFETTHAEAKSIRDSQSESKESTIDSDCVQSDDGQTGGHSQAGS